jgi:hypothetical protein
LRVNGTIRKQAGAIDNIKGRQKQDQTEKLNLFFVLFAAVVVNELRGVYEEIILRDCRL